MKYTLTALCLLLCFVSKAQTSTTNYDSLSRAREIRLGQSVRYDTGWSADSMAYSVNFSPVGAKTLSPVYVVRLREFRMDAAREADSLLAARKRLLRKLAKSNNISDTVKYSSAITSSIAREHFLRGEINVVDQILED